MAKYRYLMNHKITDGKLKVLENNGKNVKDKLKQKRTSSIFSPSSFRYSLE